MKNTATFIITIILLLASYTAAQADIAPPEPAPGSTISPSRATKVRMMAENVLMVVRETAPDVYVIEVEADFAMRNLGNVDEQMQVRFPLEDISGLGDGWTDTPTEVRNFRVRVNQLPLSATTVEQPYKSNDIPIHWAVFDVNFPIDQDINVHVSYETDIQNFESPSFIEYILGTGEGWYDSIGSATITLRFPYAVSMANILWFHEIDKIPENVVLIGKEIRWHWENYEPATDETVYVAVVNPVEWQNILDLEYQVGIRPDDIDTVLELSRKYQSAGSNKDIIATRTLGNLAEITIQQALVLHPDDIRLHLELAEIYNQRRWFEDTPYTSKLQDEIATILELEPTNERALALKRILAEDPAKLLISTLSPSPTSTSAIYTLTPKPSQTPQPLVTVQPEVVAEENDFSLQIFIGLLVLIVGFIAGTIVTNTRQRRQ